MRQSFAPRVERSRRHGPTARPRSWSSALIPFTAMDAFAALPTSSMPDELLAELEATGVELLEGPALAPYGQATDEGE